MASKTLTDQVRELSSTVAHLEERSNNLRGEVSRSDALLIRQGEDLRDLQVRLKVIESRFDDLKRAREETERRRWQIWVVGIAAVLSLVANLVLTFVRKPG